MSTELPVLSDYARRLPATWATRLRTKVLGRARRIMLVSDYHNSVPSGPAFEACGLSASAKLAAWGAEQRAAGKIDRRQEPFTFPDCQVSVVAASVLKSVHATLAMACDANEHHLPSSTLYRAARKLLDLFRAVVPQRHGDDLATLPRLAALFRNDCLFLAHDALTLAHPTAAGSRPP